MGYKNVTRIACLPLSTDGISTYVCLSLSLNGMRSHGFVGYKCNPQRMRLWPCAKKLLSVYLGYIFVTRDKVG